MYLLWAAAEMITNVFLFQEIISNCTGFFLMMASNYKAKCNLSDPHIWHLVPSNPGFWLVKNYSDVHILDSYWLSSSVPSDHMLLELSNVVCLSDCLCNNIHQCVAHGRSHDMSHNVMPSLPSSCFYLSLISFECGNIPGIQSKKTFDLWNVVY